MKSVLGLILFAGVAMQVGANPAWQEQLAAETQARQKSLQPLEQARQQGEKLAAQGETLRAWETLEAVWKETREALRSTASGREAAQCLARWAASLAESEARQSRWPKAREWALRSLEQEPGNVAANRVLEEADGILRRGAVAGEETNPALTNRFFDRLQGVRDGLKEAEQLRETGQLDLAERRFEDVLGLDPFNAVATDGIKKIYQERSLVAAQSRDLSNVERKREVREAWNNIYPKKTGATGGTEVTGPLTASTTFQLEEKLRDITIPQVDFSGADLETIRRALNTLSRQYDTDAGKAGVNFVVSADVTTAQPVNLKLRNVALGEVVRYVAQIAGVKSRLSEVGVTFSPLIETRPDLIPREFTVSPSFFREAGEAAGAGGAAPRGGAATAAGTEEPGQSAQAKLVELGVKFPPGAFAVYNRNTSRLRVVNNAEMLDLIGQLIGAAEEQTLLIQVGVRLVEINQSDLDTITVNSTLGGSGVNLLSPIPVGLLTNSSGSTPNASVQQGVNAQLNQIQGVGLLPNNTLQSFLQQGVLAGTNQTSSYALNTMELGGTILNGMQFRTLITAVSQKSSANVLANPSIVLKRGQEGLIEVIQEFSYVQEYNDPQSSIRTIIPPGGGAFNTGIPGPETVISSFPSQISDPVPIGVKLGVKPDITGDNSRVLMELKPSFVDFDGFINYGTQINSAYAASFFDEIVTILTNNIQQPVFVRRDLTLPSVEVSDGHTLMLGGLLREDIQKIDEKVPIIGDLPIFGRAFQGKTEQAIKKNTLIFVTPRILQVDGQPLNPTAGAATTASAATSP
jgi:general secretion pathway protein D